MPNNVRNQPLYLGPSGDPELMNEPTLLYPGQLGAKITIKNPGPPGVPVASSAVSRDKTYQLVQTDSSATVAPFKRAVAWWRDKAKYLVTTSVSTAGRGNIAGVFGNLGAPSPGNFGCVQTAGPAFVKYINAPTAAPSAAGLFVTPSATDGKADCIAAGTAATYPTLGTSAGVTDGNAEGLVDLNVPETP